MKKILFLALILLPLTAFNQAYWQQEVNYTIKVRLDDSTHYLHGEVSMEYINHSPKVLNELYIHLWPNAYSSSKTALGKQIYKDGNDLLKYGPNTVRGKIDSLEFRINRDVVEDWVYDVNHPDIARVPLKKPLQPGESLILYTPFRVKIPSGKISRLGHLGQSYQITQWYPKPAVFDKNGWHPYPYLNQGEFYSEYGSYDVKITLPENYTVGATGDLQNEDELQRLQTLSDSTKSWINTKTSGKDLNAFPPSSIKMKTLHYKQSKVHDFAWFADKRFWVLKDEVELPHSKRKVTTYAMFTPKNAKLWSESSEYLKDGTYYYSLWNGDYPYNQVTAVDGTISAGGGMEYPNVTVIGNSGNKETLEIVIVHEVGHNWFYGILGSNEREHGWMDEGLNTLNEIRYIQTKYKGNKRLSDMALGGRFHMDHLDYHDLSDVQYQSVARLGEDQPIETHSADFSGINYGLIMYQKTGLIFHYLKSYLGDEKFDKCMSAYFEKWKFKHPQPEDLKEVIENETGEIMDWFFHDLINTTRKVDYRVSKVKINEGKTYVTIKNVGQVNGPIPVTAIKDSTRNETIWIKPHQEPNKLIEFDFEADKIVIDPENHIPEINRNNNRRIGSPV